MPDAPYHWACDWRWWDIHYADVKATFKGKSYTVLDDERDDINPNPEYDLIRKPSRFGAGLSKDYIHYGAHGGSNSGFQAINLAYHLGAKTVLLLGIDCWGTHYFGNHPKGLAQASPYPAFIRSFETITDELQVINCSRSSLLTCFPCKRLEDVL